MVERLGWENARDEDAMNNEEIRRHFLDSVVDDPLFKRQKRLNEPFNLNKSYKHPQGDDPQQVLMWCNSL
ncbi:MAG: hypothetical protein ACKPKO_29250, partial [Candidatus Fonsibacter sp.]